MSAEARSTPRRRHRRDPRGGPLARVLESYLAGLEAGRPADPDRLIAAHPELAGPLRACLKVMHLAAGLSDAPGPPAGPFPADPDDAGITAPPGTGALTVLWPRDARPRTCSCPSRRRTTRPIVRVGSDALPDSPDGAGAGATRSWARSPAAAWASCSGPEMSTWAATWRSKVLQARHRGDPDVVGRFVEEARIGGQLQHPGIVPVHELGTLADRRPYFTMKLVKGRTLAALLAERLAARILPL